MSDPFPHGWLLLAAVAVLYVLWTLLRMLPRRDAATAEAGLIAAARAWLRQRRARESVAAALLLAALVLGILWLVVLYRG